MMANPCSVNHSVHAGNVLTFTAFCLLGVCYVTPLWYEEKFPGSPQPSAPDNVTTVGLWGRCWTVEGGTWGRECAWGPQYHAENASVPLLEYALPDPVLSMSPVLLLLPALGFLLTVLLGAVYVCCRPGAPSHLLAGGLLTLLGGCVVLMVISRLYTLSRPQGRTYIGLQMGLAGGVVGIVASLFFFWKIWRIFSAKKKPTKFHFDYTEL